MKKLFIIIVLLFTTNIVSAQDFSFGPKLGLNVSNITQNKELDVKAGFIAGAFVQYDFNNKMAISGDVLYSQQGAIMRYDNFKRKINVNYLNVPILFNYYIIDGFAIKAGLQMGVFLRGSYVDKYDNETIKSDKINYYSALDLSLPVGISYELPIGLIFDARYNIGVSGIYGDLKGGGDNAGTNSVFNFTVGYRFGK
ncbi:MAG: PorT family protein [Bacteroidetes bacterium]|nr:PorT family protein [Bacteroidota bacterium]